MKIAYILRKTIVSAALVILGLSSCRKDVITVEKNGASINNNANGFIGSSNNSGVNQDDMLRRITLTIPTQYVKTSVNGDILTIVYAEDVNVQLQAEGYDLSYSIRFNEDFSSSALNKLTYTVPASNGSYTTDWAGNDLKVLTEVTKTQKVVEGKVVVNLHLVRFFTFTRQYASAQEAIAQQTKLLNTKTDLIKFTSFVVFGKDYPTAASSSALVYTK